MIAAKVIQKFQTTIEFIMMFLNQVFVFATDLDFMGIKHHFQALNFHNKCADHYSCDLWKCYYYIQWPSSARNLKQYHCNDPVGRHRIDYALSKKGQDLSRIENTMANYTAKRLFENVTRALRYLRISKIASSLLGL